MRHFILALLITLFALPATAQDTAADNATSGEQVVAGLSQNRVSINATFVGSHILIFGAVKRDAPAPLDTGDLGVVVVVEGPSHPITVRRKEKRYGIWINTDSVVIEAAPSFYDVATSGPLEQVISPDEDMRYHVTVPQEIRLASAQETGDIDKFVEAVIRIRTRQGLYKVEEGAVNLRDDTLFDTAVELPSNLTEGDYRARIYLTRGGKVISDYETVITVRKVGLERWIYTLAHEKPLVYGLLSLFIAIAAGWGASTFFRVVLRKT